MVRNVNAARSVYIRLRPELARALDAAAAEAALSRAGWVRRTVVQSLPNDSELTSLPPSPPCRPATIPAEDLAEVSRLSASLSRVGGSVVQLCRALREGNQPSHAEAEEVLAELRTVQSETGRLVARLAG